MPTGSQARPPRGRLLKAKEGRAGAASTERTFQPGGAAARPGGREPVLRQRAHRGRQLALRPRPGLAAGRRACVLVPRRGCREARVGGEDSWSEGSDGPTKSPSRAGQGSRPRRRAPTVGQLRKQLGEAGREDPSVVVVVVVSLFAAAGLGLGGRGRRRAPGLGRAAGREGIEGRGPVGAAARGDGRGGAGRSSSLGSPLGWLPAGRGRRQVK